MDIFHDTWNHNGEKFTIIIISIRVAGYTVEKNNQKNKHFFLQYFSPTFLTYLEIR